MRDESKCAQECCNSFVIGTQCYNNCYNNCLLNNVQKCNSENENKFSDEKIENKFSDCKFCK